MEDLVVPQEAYVINMKKIFLTIIFFVFFYLATVKDSFASCTACATAACGSCSSYGSTAWLCSCAGGIPPNYDICTGLINVSTCCGDGNSCTADGSDAWGNCTYTDTCYYYVSSGSASGYSGSGSCSSNGSGSCYSLSGNVTLYSNGSGCNTTCSSSSYSSSVSSCSWVSGNYDYYYTSSNPSTYQHILSGTCSSNCYTDNGSATVYQAAPSGCGNGSCSSGTYHSSTACTYIGQSSLNDTITLTKTATDLSDTSNITFWVYASQTGSYLQFEIGEINSNEQVYNFSIGATNTWEQKTFNIDSVPSSARDAITKYAFRNTGASSSFTFYFDDIQALAFVPTPPPLNNSSNCNIEESPFDNYLLLKWRDNSSDESGFQIEKSIDGGIYNFLVNVGSGITSYQDNTVSPNHIYSYRSRPYRLDAGTTVFPTSYCNYPTLDLHTGSFKLEGLKIEGIKLN